jgi:DNA-binding XRE family transcriptional regulator
MQITTGRQIAAARALIGWDQTELAKAAGLNRNSVTYWETRTVPKCEPGAVRKIREALARNGVQVFSMPRPGVALAR